MSESFQLRPVVSVPEWDAYDDLRRRILFEARGRFGQYQARYSEEFDPGNHPLMLEADGVPIGTVRIDLRGERAWFRMVAIDQPIQRQGYGRKLVSLAEDFACRRGAQEVMLNSAPDAVGFYQKLGYGLAPPDESPGRPRMRKALAPLMQTACGLLIDRSGRVLLGLRANWKPVAPDKWDLIGGRLEPGESAEAALVRELVEELGITVRANRLLLTTPSPKPDIHGFVLHHIFLVSAWVGEVRNACDEHAELRWFDRAEILALPNKTGFDFADLISRAQAAL